jgi:hypothetical protein
MSTWTLSSHVRATLLALAVAFSPSAHATLNMTVQPYNAIQLGTGSGVQLGHTVIAGTNFNRLVAGGSFVASCDNFSTGQISGNRTLTSELIGRYNQLYVTVPETVPTLRNMPGFSSLPRGTELMCEYNWKAFAREPVYTVGLPPFQITVGGAEFETSGVVTFWMRKPATATGEDDACIP